MKEINFEVLKSLESLVLPDCEYRCMLDCISVGDYVESSTMKQQGIVKRITRNAQYVPICVKIAYPDGVTDYLSVDRIDIWKPQQDVRVDLNEYGC
jgi:hypothetical protein